MCFGGGGVSNDLAAANAARQQAISQGSANIDKVFSQYTPQFYQGVERAQLAALMPQLAQQYQQMNRQLGLGLAQKGLLHSGSAQQLGTSLQKQTALNTSLVQNQAAQASRDLQSQVVREKANVTNQLIASQDPTLASQSALASAASLQAPSQLAPLGNLFQNWAMTYLGNKLNTTYNQQTPGFGGFGQTQVPPVGASAPSAPNYNVGGRP